MIGMIGIIGIVCGTGGCSALFSLPDRSTP